MSITSDIGMIFARRLVTLRRERFRGALGALHLLCLSFVCSSWLTLTAISLGTGLETGRYFFWGGAEHWTLPRLLTFAAIKWPGDFAVQALSLLLISKFAPRGFGPWLVAAVSILAMSALLAVGGFFATDVLLVGSVRQNLGTVNPLEIIYTCTTLLPVVGCVVAAAYGIYATQSGARIGVVLALLLVLLGKLWDMLNPQYVFPNWCSFPARLPPVILLHVGVLFLALSVCLTVFQWRKKDPELAPVQALIAGALGMGGVLVGAMHTGSWSWPATILLGAFFLLVYISVIRTLGEEVSRWLLRHDPPRSPWWVAVSVGLAIPIALAWRSAYIDEERSKVDDASIMMGDHDTDKSRIVVDKYLALGMRPNLILSNNQTPFLSLSQESRLEQTVFEYAMRRMIAAGADVRLSLPWQWRSPLVNVISNGNSRVAELLIDAGADVNQRWGYSILQTSWQERDAVLSTEYPIHAAAQENEVEILRLLLLHGADPMSRSSDGQTPLHLAHTGAAGLVLIRAGANVNARDRWGSTPLHNAAHHGDLSLVRLLVENGADPNALDARGKTPLRDLLETMLKPTPEDPQKIDYLTPLTTRR